MSHSDVGNPVPIAPFAWSRAAKLEGLQYRFSPSQVDAADGLCVLVFPHLPSTSSVPLTLTLGRTSSKQDSGTLAASPGPEKDQQSGSSFGASPNIPKVGCPESPGTTASPSSTSYGHRQRPSVPPATGCSSPQKKYTKQRSNSYKINMGPAPQNGLKSFRTSRLPGNAQAKQKTICFSIDYT